MKSKCGLGTSTEVKIKMFFNRVVFIKKWWFLNTGRKKILAYMGPDTGRKKILVYMGPDHLSEYR